MIGISNEPIAVVSDFLEDQGISFPVLHDNQSIYGLYNLPGSTSPYPRDFIIDANGVVRLAKTEYEPGTMIAIIESLLDISTVALEPKSPEIPNEHILISVYPNPFNPEIRIKLVIDEAERVSLGLFDIRGRRIQEILSNQALSSGQHEFNLWAENLSSGIYLLILDTPQQSHIQKMVKLR